MKVPFKDLGIIGSAIFARPLIKTRARFALLGENQNLLEWINRSTFRILVLNFVQSVIRSTVVLLLKCTLWFDTFSAYD